MSAIAAFDIGKAIFNILNVSTITDIPGMTSGKIQPAPLIDQANPTLAITYEISAINSLNTKRNYRIETAKVFYVDFRLECIATDYSTSITLASTASKLLQEADINTYNTVKINGITMETASEDYNKNRRYYSKNLSFQAIVLL